MTSEHGLSVVRSCSALKLSRAAYYKPRVDWVDKDRTLVDELNALVQAHHRWGFWKCFDRMRNTGRGWNHKRVLRVYRGMKLNLPRRTKKRIPYRERQPLTVTALPNQVWSVDFMSDALYCGRRFRTFNVLDEGVREALAIEIDTSLPSRRVVRVLERIKQERGLPKAIRLDNGPELIAQELADWCAENAVTLRHIQPGKPDQNAFIERFNRTYREDVLDAYLFDDLEQVREITEAWIKTYNEVRPHDALGRQPPAVFRARLETRNSTSELST